MVNIYRRMLALRAKLGGSMLPPCRVTSPTTYPRLNTEPNSSSVRTDNCRKSPLAQTGPLHLALHSDIMWLDRTCMYYAASLSYSVCPCHTFESEWCHVAEPIRSVLVHLELTASSGATRIRYPTRLFPKWV